MDSIKLMPVRTQVTSILKKAIFSGEYKSGDELSLTEIGARLGVSRTPVREAFQALESEGLITLRMNKGAIVNKIDRKFVKDRFEMRILLESEAAARAAKAGMEVSDLLERLYIMRDQINDLNRVEYEALNEEIHMRIWKTADNEKLKNYLEELWNGPSTGRGHNAEMIHYEKSTYEHISILESIRDQKIEKARKAMKQHITRSMENILENYPED